MATFLLTTLLFLVIFAAMAVGVIFSNKPIKGSCGGLNNVGLGGECEICGGNLDQCEAAQGERKASPAARDALGYDATRR
ncbi:MAG: (Na+)-NQR maturation NqrM [Pseudomonadota bacterium]